jgi:hypothetical protein
MSELGSPLSRLAAIAAEASRDRLLKLREELAALREELPTAEELEANWDQGWQEFWREIEDMQQDARASGVRESKLESLTFTDLFRYRDLRDLRRRVRPVMVLQPARMRQRGARPRARRTAARRAGGIRSGQDPGEEGDPERPSSRRRGELRHISFPLAALLEEICPPELRGSL